jgi:hypothetical protein
LFFLSYSVDFSRHDSTTTAVSKVTGDIWLNLEDRQATFVAMLDFTQAFDMIAHNLMVSKMRGSQRNTDGATALLGSYLTDQMQYMRSDRRQCVLSPLLFISFIDDDSGVIRFCRIHIYSDDLQINHSSFIADFHPGLDGV